MKKIDKNCSFSTAYKNWEEDLESRSQTHPSYNSSQGKYYWDIVMQLFYCQDGLCAYTERALCKSELYDATNWENGKYAKELPDKKPFGNLEHFNSQLKKEKGWLWDNFFMANMDVNSSRVKGEKPVDNILKPDRPDYDPFKLMEYDATIHVFRPNELLDEFEFKKVAYMIDTLGLNHIDEERKDLLNHVLRRIYVRDLTWDKAENETRQFPTALKMCRLQLENDPVKFRNLLFGATTLGDL